MHGYLFISYSNSYLATKFYNMEPRFVHAVFTPFEADQVLNSPLLSYVHEDQVISRDNKNEFYFVKPSHHLATNLKVVGTNAASSHSLGRKDYWKTFWHVQLSNKVKFAWRACHDGFPTKMNLLKRGIISIGTCAQCKLEVEGSSHALYRY